MFGVCLDFKSILTMISLRFDKDIMLTLPVPYSCILPTTRKKITIKATLVGSHKPQVKEYEGFALGTKSI